MRLLDRYIIRSFIVNYLLALGVMVGMYILLDLIVNFDNFTKAAQVAATQASTSAGNATFDVIWDIVDYYAFQSLVIFQLVSGAIPLLAAGFTMVRMTRHHELTAMLASGVSLYRVAAPIILVSVGFGVLSAANQEFLISQPYVVQKLLRKHDEVNQVNSHEEPVYFVRDEDNSLITAASYDPVKKQLTDVRVIQREKDGSPHGRIMADTATWEVPPGGTSEAWVMRNALQIEDRPGADPAHQVASKEPLLVYHTPLTPRQLDLVASRKAVDFLSSRQVWDLAQSSPPINQPPLYKIMYLRLTQPLMNIIMLLIGIPFLLTREPNRLIYNMFYCVGVSAVVFAATFVIFQMGGTTLDPLLSAWLPVLIFTPVAAVMLDFIRT
ncbi:MAG TPA: LptF/LptG family permease [Phycisphaerae bacterium]|nr:LptF/LptG family permease [Phycisphaerae bacterium]